MRSTPGLKDLSTTNTLAYFSSLQVTTGLFGQMHSGKTLVSLSHDLGFESYRCHRDREDVKRELVTRWFLSSDEVKNSLSHSGHGCRLYNAQCYKTFKVHNLQMFVENWSVCSWQAVPV
jgi:hypothetical protein